MSLHPRHLVLLVGSVLLIAVPVAADWDPGMPYKMHYPQLPDPQGIDINASYPKILADDWLCTQSGPVSDIHVWGSWFNDQKFTGSVIHASIHANIPADPNDPNGFSQPGALLWSRNFFPGQYRQRLYGPPSPQTWWDPKFPYDPTVNHFNTWQYNMTEISDPFIQVEGTVYWLDISVYSGVDATGNPVPLPEQFRFGWKNSISPLFMDDAVWMHTSDPPPPTWHPISDPRIPTGLPPRSMDLAFVITPEPASMALLGIGALVLMRRRR